MQKKKKLMKLRLESSTRELKLFVEDDLMMSILQNPSGQSIIMDDNQTRPFMNESFLLSRTPTQKETG